MIVDSQQLTKLFPKVNTDLVDALYQTFTKYDIITAPRICMFLAQVGYESNSWTEKAENLNYSAQGLLATFPSHFTVDEVDSYARQPEKIANRAYANRMGNGSEASGDGWKYRGRGYIQITGHDNYEAFAASNNMAIDAAPAYMETDLGAAMCSGWFWSVNGLNDLADKSDVQGATQRINGGLTGLVGRNALYNRAIPLFR